MKQTIRIGIVADYSPTNKYHLATESSIVHAAEHAGLHVEPLWLDTDTLDNSDAETRLRQCEAIWCGTSSPYRSMEGALRAIRFARERKWPFIGTWGGFQHALVEYARNVLGIQDADHEESAPNAPVKLISKLTCSLVGQRRNVRIVPGSQVHRIYGTSETEEVFACNYGLNEAFQGQIQSNQLRISGYDDDGTARIVELPDHPFFVSTLFLPQINSQPQNPHPLIAAFLQSAAQLRRALP